LTPTGWRYRSSWW